MSSVDANVVHDREQQRGSADRVRTRWPGVRVDAVHVVSAFDGRSVRAVVHLAGLRPDDARVVLVPWSALRITAAESSSDGATWSAASLDDGRIAFERRLPPDADDVGGEWLVCVRPAEALVGRTVLHRFRIEAAPLHLIAR